MCQSRIKFVYLTGRSCVSQPVLRGLCLAQAELLSLSEHFNAVCTHTSYFQ